ncbi:MAG: hypothetical protein L3J76_05915 [Candidatus Hydrothermae bacterium]|nr:hypothetical protein [Candidatus Hydrothermae bacterium]
MMGLWVAGLLGILWLVSLRLRPRTRTGQVWEVLLALTILPGLTLFTVIVLALFQRNPVVGFLELPLWLGWVGLVGWGMRRALHGRGRILRASLLSLTVMTGILGWGLENAIPYAMHTRGEVPVMHAQRVVFREWGGSWVRLVYSESFTVLPPSRPMLMSDHARDGGLDTVYFLEVPDSLEVLRHGEDGSVHGKVRFPPLIPGVDTLAFFVWQGRRLRWRMGVPLELHGVVHGTGRTAVYHIPPWQQTFELPDSLVSLHRAVLYLPEPGGPLLHPVAVRIPAGPSS